MGRVRQFSVVCVNILHEKHPSADTVDVLGDTTVSSLTVLTGSQLSNIVSKSVTDDRSRTTGFDGANVPNNR